MIDPERYTSGAIAVANLSASIESLELRRVEGAAFDESGSVVEAVCFCAATCLVGSPTMTGRRSSPPRLSRCRPVRASALYVRARLAARFHRFEEASALLDRALAPDYPTARNRCSKGRRCCRRRDNTRGAGRAREDWRRTTLRFTRSAALASLLAEMGEWQRAERSYAAALDADDGVSPMPCGQLLFEWGVSAMRRGDLDRAEEILAELDTILPAHVPARGHRAEVALACGQLDAALALITPLLEMSDDPEYRATYAEILAARGDERVRRPKRNAQLQPTSCLLARRPEAYADHAAAFFMGIGNRPQLAVELAAANWKLRDTPRSRRLLDRGTAQRGASLDAGGARRMTLALAGLLAGFVHVLSGPDHLAAVAPYAAARKASAWRTGVRWGLGHSAGVLGVGLLALMLRDALPVETLSAWSESCVGLVLIGIGVWGLRKAVAATRVDTGHGQRAGVHGHAAFAVGTVHGLAGSSHVLGIAPALILPSNGAAATYLILFGAGSVAAMGLFSSLIGWIAAHPVASGVTTQSALLGLCSVLALSVGGFWLASDFMGHTARDLVVLVAT